MGGLYCGAGHWQTVMAFLLHLSYLSFGCNWELLSATEGEVETVSLCLFFAFIFGLLGVCVFDF